MRNTYELHVLCRCPVNDQIDTYQMTVESDDMIPCETILQVTAEVRDFKFYQEVLTERFARTLRAKVKLVGWHSGVKVTSDFDGERK